jgi:hypothetical protein
MLLSVAPMPGSQTCLATFPKYDALPFRPRRDCGRARKQDKNSEWNECREPGHCNKAWSEKSIVLIGAPNASARNMPVPIQAMTSQAWQNRPAACPS